MKLTLKIFKYTLLTLYLILCGILVYFAVSKIVFKKENPKFFGVSVVTVNPGSGSMYPTLKPYDMLFVKQQDSYEVDDIITYKDGSSFTTHRIVEITDEGFVTKGDFNESIDTEIVHFDDVEGEVVVVLKGFGKVMIFLSSPLGIMCVLMVFFLIFVSKYLILFIKNQKKVE